MILHGWYLRIYIYRQQHYWLKLNLKLPWEQFRPQQIKWHVLFFGDEVQKSNTVKLSLGLYIYHTMKCSSRWSVMEPVT